MPSSRGVRLHVRQRDLRRLLHHVAELAGEVRPSPSIVRRLDEEHVAARTGDGQAGRHAGHAGALRDLGVELGAAQRAVARRRRRSRPAASRRPPRSRAAVLRSSFPSSRSRLRTPASRVWSTTTARSASSVTDDVVGGQPVALELAGQQVVAGDGDLLVLGVAVEADDLQAVEQRAGDGRRARWRSRGTARRTGRGRPRGSGRGTCGSAPGRAPRAAPTTGRPASRRRACRPRRAGRPGSWCRPR